MTSLLTSFLAIATLSAAVPSELDIPFEKYTLATNGLEVILHEDHSLPLVAINLWYHTGPVNEPEGRSGFAHLFEHLMFQGSKHVGIDMHFKYLEKAGATGVNGTTSYDRTNYFETLPSNQLELGLWLESDRMGFLMETLTQKMLDNQRDVVMNERRQSIDNAPYAPSSEKLVKLIFPDSHPYYGYVMGSMDHIKAATLDDVRDFYQQYYAPANATLVIAGDFKNPEVKELVKKYFANLTRREAPAVKNIVTPPITKERRLEVEEPVQLVRVKMGWLSPKVFTASDADADGLAFALGAGKSSRLYKTLVYEKELAQSVSAHQQSMGLSSIFAITVKGRPGVDAATLELETQKIIDEMVANGPTENEILRARNQLRTSMISGLQALGGFGGRADMLNRYNQYTGDPGYFLKDLARYEQMSVESVHKLAQEMLKSEQRAVVTTLPAPPVAATASETGDKK